MVLLQSWSAQWRPTHVVFNRAVGGLIGASTCTAGKTGERLRFFVGNAGPNLVSSFYIIGGIMGVCSRSDESLQRQSHNMQTVLIPSGGAAVVGCTPGTLHVGGPAAFHA